MPGIVNSEIDPHLKQWIDNATYKQLLRRWRFADSRDPIVQGETGRYFEQIIYERRDAIGEEQHSAISKEIGF